MKQVEFYFDCVSPSAYLGYKQLKKLCGQQGAEIVYKPILLGGVFQSTGNNSPMTVPAKMNWVWDDWGRFAERYQVPFVKNPYFPLNLIQVMRGAIAARQLGCLEAYVDAMFSGMWEQGLNLGDIEVVEKLLADAGLDAKAILDKTQDPEIKETLKSETAAAVERGIFGAPTMFVGGVMHFGQDRLDFVEAALQA